MILKKLKRLRDLGLEANDLLVAQLGNNLVIGKLKIEAEVFGGSREPLILSSIENAIALLNSDGIIGVRISFDIDGKRYNLPNKLMKYQDLINIFSDKQINI